MFSDSLLVGALTLTWPLYIYSYKQSVVSPILNIGLHACRIVVKLYVPLLESKVNSSLDIFPQRHYIPILFSYGLISLGILAPLDEIQFKSKFNLKQMIWLAISHTTEALVFYLVFSRLERFIHPSERNYIFFRYSMCHILSLFSSCLVGNTIHNYRLSSKIFYKFLFESTIHIGTIIKELFF